MFKKGDKVIVVSEKTYGIDLLYEVGMVERDSDSLCKVQLNARDYTLNFYLDQLRLYGE